MSAFTEAKVLEGRKNGSRETLLEALIPVVMAGGRYDNLSGGMMLSLVLRSTQAAGVDPNELFAYAAQFAISEESARQIREFPSLPPEQNDIRRFGRLEKETPDGVVYLQPPEWTGQYRKP